MNNFTAHLIQNKSVIRKIQILESLIDSEGIVSSCVLAHKLQCTSRTIISDISQLKHSLPNTWDIVSINSKGYILKKDPLDQISSIIATYVINSELYNILCGIFNQKYYSLEKWSQILYLDKLTLKKKLNNFRKVLRHFKLDFNFRTTIQLIGKELNIRYFYMIFFFHVQKYKEIFKTDLKLQQKIENYISFYNIEIDYNLLTILTNVSINRNICKHFISKNFNIDYIFSSDKLDCTYAIISEIENFYKVSFRQNELSFFTLFFFLISEGEVKEKSKIKKYYRESHKQLYDKHLALIDMISSEVNMNVKVIEEIKHSIHFSFHKIYICKHLDLPLDYFWGKFKTIPHELIEGYNIIHPLVISWNKKINENRLTEDELCHITFHILSILLSKYKKKVLLLLSGPTNWKKFIYHKLNNELGNVLILQTEPGNPIKFDFIITNYKISNNQIPVIWIPDKLMLKDLKSIKQLLNLSL
ncbi:helix-turn-helix domain-containing protein [Paenibacillus dendritiformis]|uniref:helix-turn-helix domain-containing protein n=1 Tax=Paenibacillus dendritiformis TaxID=130049 RepID=UPI00387E0E35